LKVVQW